MINHYYFSLKLHFFLTPKRREGGGGGETSVFVEKNIYLLIVETLHIQDIGMDGV